MFAGKFRFLIFHLLYANNSKPMANRHESFGIAKDEEEKTRAKYSEDTENEVVAWISCITGESPNGSGFDVSNVLWNF